MTSPGQLPTPSPQQLPRVPPVLRLSPELVSHHASQVFSKELGCLLMARLSTDTLLGTQIAQLTGNDVDSGPALSYSLVLDGDTVGTFSVLRYGGRITLTGPLDYEQRSHYTLILRASDSRHETEANLTVVVEDVNDNAPTFSQGFYQVPAPCPAPAPPLLLPGSPGPVRHRDPRPGLPSTV